MWRERWVLEEEARRSRREKSREHSGGGPRRVGGEGGEEKRGICEKGWADWPSRGLEGLLRNW